MLKVALLGTLHGWRNDVPLNLGPRQQQLLFALLLARAGKLVQLSEISELVWGAHPPPTAVNMVHRYVGGIRRILEGGRTEGTTGGRIVLEPGGYRFVPGDVEFDLHRFRKCLDAAHQASDDQTALDRLLEALGVWRGRCAMGLSDALDTHPDFAAIDREFVAAAREAGQAARNIARSAEVLPALREAARRDPLDETVQAELMLALAADGKQAEAFGLFGEIRSRLAEELGVDPGRELTAAYDALLHAHEPEPAGRASRPVVVPAQLPSNFPLFTGRETLVDATLTQLRREPAAVRIVGFDGMPGIGKTTLAVHVAHLAAGGYPDGQLYADLRGFDAGGQVANPADVLIGFLDALGIRPEAIPVSLDARAALFRSVLVNRRMLIMLDNARDAEHIRSLLPGTAGNAVLVTSRSPLVGLAAAHGAHIVSLGLPSVSEARATMARWLGPDRVLQETAALDEIIRWCGRLPLALSIVAARATVDADLPLATIAADLRKTPQTLDTIGNEDLDQDVRAVFSWSYRLLSPGAARLFGLLPRYAGPDVTVEVAASLEGEPPATTRQHLAELVRTGLLHRHRPGRYRLHDLVRTYGSELGPPDHFGEASRRLFDHYLHTAAAAVRLLRPGYQIFELPPVPARVTPVAFADEADVMDWSTREGQSLYGVVVDAAGQPAGPAAWRLALLTKDLFHRHGWWDQWATMFTVVLQAAERSSDAEGMAQSHRSFAVACHYIGDSDAADHHLKIALELFDSSGDELGRGLVLMNQGYLAHLRADEHTALERLPEALTVFRRLEQRQLEAVVLATLAEAHLAVDDLATARKLATRAAHLCCELQDVWNGTRAAGTLARIHRRRRNFVSAVRLHQHCIDLLLSRNGKLDAAHHRNELAATLLAAGDVDAARQVWTQVVSSLAEAASAPPAVVAQARLAD